jgi:predicted nucleotide-binding protein (sugar kinase/HSP70/actin superfamily)
MPDKDNTRTNGNKTRGNAQTNAQANGNNVKKVYVPYMCDHGYTVAAAMRSHGLPTEVLEPTNTDTLALGLRYCIGRECLPCLTTTGDILQRAQQPDFDPESSAIFMPTTTGSCRFGHYNVLQKSILDQEGLQGIEFLSPSATNSYQGFGEKPTQLRLLIWQGAVAADLLIRLLHQHRPYEKNKGQTDQIYKQCLDRVVAATEEGGGKKLVEAMRYVAEQFEALPVDKSQERPIIGVVGEIYLRFNFVVNIDLVRQVENLGGEAQIASIIEWLYYTNWDYKNASRSEGKPLEWLKTAAADMYQRHLEHNLVKPIEHLLHHAHETHTSILMENLLPYYHPDLASEAILSMGAAIDFGKRGFDGIINVMPFSCMPGIITAGMAPRIRADLNNIPWLDISYDAQGETNIKTRLEAFLYQALQFKRATKKAVVE